MNKNLIIIPTKKMSRDEWLRYRKTGVGASEVGAIMGLSPYKSSIELFYDKIGPDLGYTLENIHMFMGKEQEAFVARLWQYWAGSEDSMMENYRANKIIRRCQRVNAYIRNPKYPWLFVSLDRKINKTKTSPEAALEIKTINGYEADKWEGGIPPSHVVQVQTQLKVCMFDNGELATFRDGRRMDVIPFEPSKEVTQAIIHQTHEFWKRVEAGKVVSNKIFNARRTYNFKDVDEFTAQLASLEPEPDNSDAYNDFLTAKYSKSVAGERSGTITELNDALKHRGITEQVNELLEDRRLFENRLKSSMGDTDRLTFGDKGFVSWKTDISGTRRFTNKVSA